MVDGLQPVGARLGTQGPDQGYALDDRPPARPELSCTAGANARTTRSRAASAIALRRASLFSRAPVVHDLRIAFTIWGYLRPGSARPNCCARRAELFEGVGNINHHYAEGRRIADLVPESTLRMTPQQVDAAYPASGSR